MDLVNRSIFAVLFIALFIVKVIYVKRSPWSSKTRQERWADFSKEGRRNAFVLFAMYFFYISWCLLIIFSPFFIWWSYFPLDLVWTAFGTVLGLFSIFLIYWAHKTLGESFTPTVAGFEGQNLVTNGPYSIIRHPLYTGHTLFHLALSLISANWVFFVFFIAVIRYTMRRVGFEEQNLLEQFGIEYQNYMKHTSRFFPCFRRKL